MEEEEGGEHLTGVPDRVTSLLPFPPTWYNVLEVSLSAASPRNDRAEGTEDAFGFETSSQSIERERERTKRGREKMNVYIYVCSFSFFFHVSLLCLVSLFLSFSLSSRLWP